MNQSKPHFIQMLEHGNAQTLCVYGTSLSAHLGPHLRDALKSRFGELVNVLNTAMPAKASRSGLEHLTDRVIRHSPDAVLLEFAVNDAYSYFDYSEELDAGITLEESRENLVTLIDILKAALPACEVILQTMNPAWDAPESSLPETNRPELERFYEQYREVAWARGLQLIDNYPFWQEIKISDRDRFERLIPDGVHPTPEALKTALVPHLLRQWGLV